MHTKVLNLSKYVEMHTNYATQFETGLEQTNDAELSLATHEQSFKQGG